MPQDVVNKNLPKWYTKRYLYSTFLDEDVTFFLLSLDQLVTCILNYFDASSEYWLCTILFSTAIMVSTHHNGIPNWHLLLQNQHWKQQNPEICSKLTIKTIEWRQRPRSGVFIINWRLSVVFLLTLNRFRTLFRCFHCWLWTCKCTPQCDTRFLISNTFIRTPGWNWQKIKQKLTEAATGGVLRNFAIPTGKYLCWRLFLIKLQAFKPAT